MAGATIRVDIEDASARDVLAQLRAAATDLTPAMEDIGAQLRQHVDERFEGGFGPAGGIGPFQVPWKKSQRAIEQSGQTLVRSGRLRQSITYRADADGVEVGTNVEYAAPHQFGAEIQQGEYTRKVAFRAQELGGLWTFLKKDSRHKGRFDIDVTYGARVVSIPARPFLGWDMQDEAAVLDIAADHLRRAMGAAAP